jgi:hypothetical protein
LDEREGMISEGSKEEREGRGVIGKLSSSLSNGEWTWGGLNVGFRILVMKLRNPFWS